MFVLICLLIMAVCNIDGVTKPMRYCNDCSPLNECTLADNLAKQKKHFNRLWDAHCGFMDSTPMVCCLDFGPVSTSDHPIPLVDTPETTKPTPIAPTISTPTAPPTEITKKPSDPPKIDVTPEPKIEPIGTTPVVPESFKNDTGDIRILMQNKTGTDENNDYLLHPNLALLPESCGDINGNRVTGGTIAVLNEFPWMALIGYMYDGIDQKYFWCGGSLIADRYVLTAAHCINRYVKFVRLGEYDIQRKSDCQGDSSTLICQSFLQDILIEKIVKHENFRSKPFLQNDITLLRLSQPADLTHSNIAPICLPFSNNLQSKDLAGEVATVAGWGKTESGQLASVLRKAEIPIGTTQNCIESTKGAVNKLENVICAGVKEKDTCEGDSGGGLFIKDNNQPLKRSQGSPVMFEDVHNRARKVILYGIVSSGSRNCGSRDYAGLYTDVRKYTKWILDNMEF